MNKDSEEEIADLMGYATRITEEIKSKKRTEASLNNYDRMILQAHDNNLLTVPTNRSNSALKKMAKAINSTIIIP